MASYVQNAMFGDAGDFSLDSMFDYSAGGTDVSSSSAVSPDYTSGGEGEDSGGAGGWNWGNIIAGTLNLGAQVVRVAAGSTTPAATPMGVVAKPPLKAPVSSGSSSTILLLGLGAVALLMLKK
jgi:hypothetical protein